MENIKYYISIVLFIITISSCSDILDVEPKDLLDANTALQSLDDYNNALNGAYSVLRGDGIYGESMFFLPDLMSDNLRVGDSNGGALRTQANWTYSPGNDIDTWEDCYTLIFRANTVINSIDGITETIPGQKNRILGQALVLRALGHFDLLRYYAQEYSRNSTAPGVPIKLLGEDISKPVRNTVAEVYDQIFTDLLSARTMLSNVDVNIQENGTHYFDLNATNALLARVSLYAELWQDAIDYSTEVLSKRSLVTSTEYLNMWLSDEPGEVLFSVSFASASDGRIALSMFDFTINRSTFTATLDLANIYDQVNDTRFSIFLKANEDPNPGDDMFLPIKYPGRGGERGLTDAKVLRVSELYLIRAEANTNINNDVAALTDLNTLRSARITGYVDENLSGAALKDAIQTERRKELAFEGHRWFDLRRIKAGIARGQDCRGLTINCSLAADDHRFIYPIPQSEILANENMVQNNGY